MGSWKVNLSGSALPIYSVSGSGPSTTQIGTLTKNECFVDGSISSNPWEGDGAPVIFLNSSHVMTFGLLANYVNNLVDFTAYASNGTSWVAVNTLERKVAYATYAYDKSGKQVGAVPAGYRVWLTSSGTAGDSNHNYIAVSKITDSSGNVVLSGAEFIDLTYGNRWINVGSILLRKA